jgi:hypothetical protein
VKRDYETNGSNETDGKFIDFRLFRYFHLLRNLSPSSTGSIVRKSAAITYILLVIVCIFLAFNFDGSIDADWTLILIALTLPFSFISFFFAWSLFHGAGLEFFTLIYLVSAGLNIYIASKLTKLLRRRDK